MKNYLEENKIASEYRNEFSSSVMGEVAFFDVWPELWVADCDSDESVNLLKQLQQNPMLGPDWNCNSCKELNPYNFETCWQCGKDD